MGCFIVTFNEAVSVWLISKTNALMILLHIFVTQCLLHLSSTFKILFFHRVSSLSFIASAGQNWQSKGHLYWWLLICKISRLIHLKIRVIHLILPQRFIRYLKLYLFITEHALSFRLVLITSPVNGINHQSSWKPSSCSVLTNHYSHLQIITQVLPWD